MRSQLREQLTPIEDDALPMLRAHALTAVRSLSVVLIVMTVAYASLEVAMGQWSTAAARPLVGAACLGVFLASRGRGARHPQLLLFILAAALMAGMQLPLLADDGPEIDLTPLLGFVPLLLVAFVPWRPSLSLLLTAMVLCLATLRHVLGSPAEAAMPAEIQLFVTLCLGVLSALASQVQRRVWYQLEAAKTRADLLSFDKMASLGRLTAGIAHELKTPVAAALNGAESARHLVAELRDSIGHPQVDDADLRTIAAELDDSLGGIRGDVERCARYVHAIRDQTRSMNEVDRVAVNVLDRVDAVRALLSHRLKTSRIRLEVDVAEDVVVTGDPGKLDQVLTNLVTNALDACEPHSTASCVTISASRRSGGVVVHVRDDGPGVPVELQQRIFEMLFTTRGREGTGLGLAICREIAEGAFGGRLALVPSRVGASFELFCPDLDARASRAVAVPWRPLARSA